MTEQFTSLQGYKVLDLTQYLSGPLCTTILAALGAEVIKVEPPEGDGNRNLPPFLGSEGISDHRSEESDESLVSLKRNPGKKSIVLDLKTSAGKEVVQRLMRTCDVLLHNFRPGVAERLGVDAATVRNLNPNLIYCSIAGQFGGIGALNASGDYPEGGVIDVIGQALSGLLGSTGPEDGPPVRSRAPIADQVAGMYATIAVLSSIVERDAGRGSGRATSSKVPMVESLASLVWDESLDTFQAGGLPERLGNSSGRISPYGIFAAADGGYVALAAASTREWQRLVDATGIQELGREEWLDISMRLRDRDEIDSYLTRWVASVSAAEVLHRLKLRGVTVGAVLTLQEMLAPGAYREGVLFPVSTPTGGTVAWAPRFPLERDGVRLKRHGGDAPGLGADGQHVLQEVCEYTKADVTRLVTERAFGTLDYGGNWRSSTTTHGNDQQEVVDATDQEVVR